MSVARVENVVNTPLGERRIEGKFAYSPKDMIERHRFSIFYSFDFCHFIDLALFSGLCKSFKLTNCRGNLNIK